MTRAMGVGDDASATATLDGGERAGRETYGTIDVERARAREEECDKGVKGDRRGRTRVGVGVLIAVACAAAALTATARSARGARGANAELGVQPDARGVAPMETNGFVRQARKNYGAALMRASYHQTREVGDVDTAEEADAEADRDAVADVVDEEFYEDFDSDGDGSMGGLGKASEERKGEDATTGASRGRSTSGAARGRASAAPPSGDGFLSRVSREEALKNQRVKLRRDARAAQREAVRKEDETAAAGDDLDFGYDVDEEDAKPARVVGEGLSEDQKYFKSINGGWFHVAAAATRDSGDGGGAAISLHNTFGEIPGLVDHLKANGAKIGQMRVVTYANSAYWPVAQLFIASARRNAPDVLDALTVMVTDRATLKQCVETGVMCFLDTDMIEILGEHMNADGSISAGQADVSGDLGKALRIVWTWRKVHVVYTLVQAGYGCLFLDASTVLLNDPRELVRSKLDSGALLVTLSDFGGKLEQKAINTGLIAARPNEYIGKLLEDWMKLEPDASDTEQAALTWNIAPNARADGVIITALSQGVAPSYLTFDVAAHMNRDSGQFSGYLVHAAYCGSVKGKIAFLSRVERLSEDTTKMLPVTEDEQQGCDVFDRHKFHSCGLAPWDGVCE